MDEVEGQTHLFGYAADLKLLSLANFAYENGLNIWVISKIRTTNTECPSVLQVTADFTEK